MAQEVRSYTRAHDTIERMEQACMHRLKEGRSLQAMGMGYWAVYTLGYVVEMCLKTAFLRLVGLDTHEDAREYLVGNFPRQYARSIGVSRTTGAMHDLWFWFELIVAERNQARKPIDREFFGDCGIHVQRIASYWRPGMRYHPSIPMGERTLQVAVAATWIREHQQSLWR